ncbi:MAG: AlpA family phage regulatory protein [Gammaproteobacteria bacterium]|jgi:prophage regulatory protein|nr:AlpA family phage regulatory protein [Gammaproteobacteria bacterium]
MDKTLLSYREVQEIIGRSRSTISRWVADGLFPAPKEIAPQIVGWLKTDIEDWLGNLPSKGSPAVNVVEE